MRTQVTIIGAGPAGLMLGHLLHLRGIESVILEARSRKYVEERVRAGVLEQGTVDLLNQTGLGDRMSREGLLHHGIELGFAGKRHRIDMQELTGNAITVYGQHEVVKDLIAARLAFGGEIVFEAANASIHNFDGDTPLVRYEENGVIRELRCDYIAGCDGFHGICRPFPRALSRSTSVSIRSDGSESSPMPRLRRTSSSTCTMTAASPSSA